MPMYDEQDFDYPDPACRLLIRSRGLAYPSGVTSDSPVQWADLLVLPVEAVHEAAQLLIEAGKWVRFSPPHVVRSFIVLTDYQDVAKLHYIPKGGANVPPPPEEAFLSCEPAQRDWLARIFPAFYGSLTGRQSRKPSSNRGENTRKSSSNRGENACENFADPYRTVPSLKCRTLEEVGAGEESGTPAGLPDPEARRRYLQDHGPEADPKPGRNRTRGEGMTGMGDVLNTVNKRLSLQEVADGSGAAAEAEAVAPKGGNDAEPTGGG